MFLSIIKIYPRPGIEHTVIDVLDSMKVSIAASGDCLGCSVSVEQGEEGGVCYLEQWRNREALDRHLRSALFNRVLEMMELSSTPPEVAFYEVSGIGGLELIEQARAVPLE